MTLIDDSVGATQGRATDTQNDEQVEATAPALRDTAKGDSTGAATAQPGAAGMRVKKRSGALEPVDVNKIVAFESALIAHIRSNNADLLDQINAEGDFNDDIAAAIGKAG